ncbi:MAG TPA: MazG family protein [Stackebrandtia sp.]|jgi:XTP/dITP diphosphohydrolase|uniref:MazG family protein n=1 Tax=Stackebrandtia sp. TaxID=2023065 RepID=UPI002D5639BD|nr:MazG family protein [Stackebrandtia sp.]HZE41259.1 MazG family protein [Stackebrandtia sp.]
MSTRLVWLVTSPRLPAGLLSAPAWDALRAAEHVYSASDTPQVSAIRAANVDVAPLDPSAAVDTLLDSGGVWIASDDGDAELSRLISERLATDPSRAEIELLHGSWDSPGARLMDLVAVIDRLRSPGGCPWDAAQTHASLAPFLLEEAYETVDAIDSGDLKHLREELGDLLMQPLLHARFASEDADGFTIDDVAGDAVDKLIRRHPHVFADTQVSSVEDLHDNWDAIKRTEKPERRYATDGVVEAQPALSLAAKYLSRIARANLDVAVPAAPEDPTSSADALGEALLWLVARAREADIDPELALRRAALAYGARSRAVEDERKSG